MVEKTELTEGIIKSEVMEHYGMKVNDIKALNGGSANVYKLTSDSGNEYILKEFQSKFSEKMVLKEINVINFLKGKGLSVPEYDICLDGKPYFEYKDKVVIVQKFIDGYIKKIYSGGEKQMLESAKYLGIIVNDLEDYPYDDMFSCNMEKYTSDEIIDKSIAKHEKLILLARKDKRHGSKIVKDLKDKIEMLKEVKQDGVFKKATNVTIKKTHGDYSVLQFIYDDNDKIKAIIDFVNAGEMPIVWEIARSYNYIDKDCKNGEFNIKHLVMYVKEYLKYSKLNKDDLKYLPYVYLIQVLSSAYGYKEYLNSGNRDLLRFGKERTNICRYLVKNAKIISEKLLEINL